MGVYWWKLESNWKKIGKFKYGEKMKKNTVHNLCVRHLHEIWVSHIMIWGCESIKGIGTLTDVEGARWSKYGCYFEVANNYVPWIYTLWWCFQISFKFSGLMVMENFFLWKWQQKNKLKTLKLTWPSTSGELKWL